MSGSLDTSGWVRDVPYGPVPGLYGDYLWSDLSPFAQGYVEALLREISVATPIATIRQRPVGFSDLSPEVLALILRDCEAWLRDFEPKHAKDMAKYGRERWERRAAGLSAAVGFPPLRVFLRDDGRVGLEPASASGSGMPSDV